MKGRAPLENGLGFCSAISTRFSTPLGGRVRPAKKKLLPQELITVETTNTKPRTATKYRGLLFFKTLEPHQAHGF
jgi:hypothetical protein